jgi:hypothetical protein
MMTHSSKSETLFSSVAFYFQYLILSFILLVALNIYPNPGQGFTHLSCIRTPACGEREALPPTAYEGVMLLRRNTIKSASLSTALSGNALLYQRIVEAAYPIRIQPDAEYALIAHQDPPGIGCVLLEQATMLSLYRCRRYVP